MITAVSSSPRAPSSTATQTREQVIPMFKVQPLHANTSHAHSGQHVTPPSITATQTCEQVMLMSNVQPLHANTSHAHSGQHVTPPSVTANMNPMYTLVRTPAMIITHHSHPDLRTGNADVQRTALVREHQPCSQRSAHHPVHPPAQPPRLVCEYDSDVKRMYTLVRTPAMIITSPPPSVTTTQTCEQVMLMSNVQPFNTNTSHDHSGQHVTPPSVTAMNPM